MAENGLLHLRSFDCICGGEQSAHLYLLRKSWKRERSMPEGERGNKIVWEVEQHKCDPIIQTSNRVVVLNHNAENEQCGYSYFLYFGDIR